MLFHKSVIVFIPLMPSSVKLNMFMHDRNVTILYYVLFLITFQTFSTQMLSQIGIDKSSNVNIEDGEVNRCYCTGERCNTGRTLRTRWLTLLGTVCISTLMKQIG